MTCHNGCKAGARDARTASRREPVSVLGVLGVHTASKKRPRVPHRAQEDSACIFLWKRVDQQTKPNRMKLELSVYDAFQHERFAVARGRVTRVEKFSPSNKAPGTARMIPRWVVVICSCGIRVFGAPGVTGCSALRSLRSSRRSL